MKKLISIDIVIRDSFDGREERHEPVAQPVDPEKPIVTTNGGEGYTPVSLEQPEGDIIINRVCPPNCKGNILDHADRISKLETEIRQLKENQCEPDLCTNYVLTPDEAHLVDKTRAESKAEINRLKIDNEALENIRQEYFKEIARLKQENEGLKKELGK